VALAMLDSRPITSGGPISDAFEWIEGFFNYGESRTESNGTTTMTWTNRGDRLTVRLKGDVDFGEDDSSIVALDGRGYFAVEERRNGRRREVDVEPRADGTIEYTYFENRREQPFDEAARAWLKRLLPEIIRATGIGAEKRVQYILGKRGVEGVLTEIDRLDRDWVIRRYTSELLAADVVTDDQIPVILNRTMRRMDSDYEMAELLIAVADESKHDPIVLASYVDAARLIDSDYELRRVISGIEIDGETSPQTITAVFDLAGQIESDYERAELLIALAEVAEANRDVHREFLRAARAMDSDYELRRVISSLGSRHDLSNESLAEVLALAEAIDSDYEKAELLIGLVDDCDDAAVRMNLLKVASTLGNDYEIRRVLSAQRYDCGSDQEMIIGVMRLLQNISSDYEKVEALIELAECAAANPAVRMGYFACLDNISSDYESTRVILAYLEESRLEDDAEALAVLTAVAALDSDYEQSEVLKKLARRCRGTKALEDAFLNIVDDMESEYEASELYRKLYRRDRDRDDG
jgi:DnaJ-domain-containing protein 1